MDVGIGSCWIKNLYEGCGAMAWDSYGEGPNWGNELVDIIMFKFEDLWKRSKLWNNSQVSVGDMDRKHGGHLVLDLLYIHNLDVDGPILNR